MRRRIHYIPIIFFSFVLWTGEASAQSCTGSFREPRDGRVLGMFVSDIDRTDPYRERGGRAGHAQPGVPDLLLRESHPTDRPLARRLGTRAAGIDASRAPWCFPNLGGMTIDGGTSRWTRANGNFRRGRRSGLHLARPLLRLSAALVDRGAAGLWAASKGAVSTSPGYRSSTPPGATTNCRSC